MPVNLDLNALRVFTAVIQSGSFTSAADLLNITQSTVSHQIRKLEQKLDRQLLIRTTRRISTTPEGEILLREAKAILALVDAAETRLSGDTLTGEVRLGVPEEITNNLLSDLLARFRESQPHIRLALKVDIGKYLIDAVDRDQLDLAVVKQVPARDEHLGKQALVWAGSSKLLSQDPVPLAFFSEPCILRSHAIAVLKKANINYEIVMTTTSNQSLHTAARSGLAIAVLADSQCPPDLRLNPDNNPLPSLGQMGYQLYLSAQPTPLAIYLEKLIRDALW